MKDKFKVGDFVQVSIPYYTYTTYNEMFMKLGFKNTRVNRSFAKGTVAQVFVIGHHPSTDDVMYGLIDAEGNECLMGPEGVIKPDFIKSRKIIHVKISSDYTANISSKGIEVGCQSIGAPTLQRIIDAAKEVGLIE